MPETISLTDLPPDILYCIFPYLGASDFLRLTNCTKALFPYREDPRFWHALTRDTFRIPPQPLLQGGRWQWLYKKLLTQTRLYTWGNDDGGNLGHAEDSDSQVRSDAVRPTRGDVMHRRRARGNFRHARWPRPAIVDENVGIVADVQCGGWSTTLLNSIGAIYVFGSFNGLWLPRRANSELRRLKFPAAYPPTTKHRYEPSTAIRQYSTGRSSVLGLSDDGKVWMWEQDRGFQVRPVHVDLVENKVERVATGESYLSNTPSHKACWDRSSMYVTNVGIIYWASVRESHLVQGGQQEALQVHDAMLIESVTIPGTSYRRKKNERNVGDSLESRIGQVTNHVVLAGYIVFTTDLNKIFCYRTTFPMPASDVPEPIEISTFYNALPDQPFIIRDIQGAFTRFAVFTDSGNIITGTEEFLNQFHHASTSSTADSPIPLPVPDIIPSLQSKNIISLAFGDHHFHALHANGTITSYAQELQRCGALGLGNSTIAALRGVFVTQAGFGNGRLPDGEGRTVWFEPLMENWLEDVFSKSEATEANERRQMLLSGHEGVRKAIADYLEHEGSKWEEGVTKDGEMGAYFTLKVAAAGWHSAALVLVDEEKASKARQKHIVKPSSQKSRDSSPAPSSQSDDSYEVIDSPGEQLVNAVYDIYEWLWEFCRWFLGLTQRDAAREFAKEQHKNDNREETEDGPEVVYTWSNDPFPRLRLPDGEVMPGEIPLTE